MMRRAFSTLGCEEFHWDEVMSLARRHEITALELRALGGSIDLAGYLDERFGAPETWAREVRKAGVEIVAMDASCRLFANDPESEIELMALAPWADAVDCHYIRVFDGGERLDNPTLVLGATRWAWWRQQRKLHDWSVDLLVETHDALTSAAAVQTFQEAIPEPPDLLWDTFLTWAKGGETPAVTWSQIKDSVRHIHVKDGVMGGREGRAFTLGLPGKGEFPMASLMACLQADGYTGAVSLEWARKWHPYLPSLEEALEMAAAQAWW